MRYFCVANNLRVLTHLNYLAEDSCLETLARKQKKSIARVRKKCKIGLTWSISYLKKGKIQHELWIVYSSDKIRKMRNYKGNPNITINKYIFQSCKNLSLKAELCEKHSKTVQLPNHHIGTIYNANHQRIMKELKYCVKIVIRK
ncbi:hypothetical protein OC698_01625 ['Gossypium sp.' phytoplasma]|uniref:Domain X domain-containing protein n=1 Tax=Candidatus Phytoplasma gossypii TaxID=2982629 RepID=A0ABT9D1A7_9MOLU|nr:group II intron reverse transcriptase/maturase ['Gossypium sp.' phytoplasma]MDO8057392.1 hypothetical protein ['Gossypium sp.' phytoplasma]